MNDQPTLLDRLKELLADRPCTMDEICRELGVDRSDPKLRRATSDKNVVWDPDMEAYRLKDKYRR